MVGGNLRGASKGVVGQTFLNSSCTCLREKRPHDGPRARSRHNSAMKLTADVRIAPARCARERSVVIRLQLIAGVRWQTSSCQKAQLLESGLRVSSGSQPQPTHVAPLRSTTTDLAACRSPYVSPASRASAIQWKPTCSVWRWTGWARCSAASWVPGSRQLPAVKSSWARPARYLGERGSPPRIVFAPAI